jgi:hypothetical protein
VFPGILHSRRVGACVVYVELIARVLLTRPFYNRIRGRSHTIQAQWLVGSNR